MTLWLILTVMTALAVGLVVWPLLRRRDAALGRREYELSVYRAQLLELERDLGRGVLRPDEASAARLEIQRRMLAADAAGHAPAPARPAHRRRLALGLALALPALCALLYWQLGAPDLPGRPFAGQPDERRDLAVSQPATGEAEGLPSVESLIGRLEERVRAAPDDLSAWVRLARAYDLAEQPAQAAEAYARAIALDGGQADLHAAYAEAAILAAGGVVTEPAQAALGRALALEPANPRARFYRGLMLAQRGARAQALEVWAALIRDTPADAPWLPPLRERATALALDLGLDPETAVPAPATPGAAAPAGPQAPGAEERQALADLSPEQQAEMIRGMVEGLAARLEEDPDDVQGWRMLARSYQVLGERERSAEAYARLAALLPEGSPERAEVLATIERLRAAQ